MNILIVDDNRSMRKTLEAMVSSIDITAQIVLAASYEEAASTLTRIRFDGAIVDLVLGKSSGIEVAELCCDKGVKVVFCTSTKDEYNDSLMYNYGWIISKPLNNSAITRAIEYFKGN